MIRYITTFQEIEIATGVVRRMRAQTFRCL